MLGPLRPFHPHEVPTHGNSPGVAPPPPRRAGATK